MKSDDTRLAHAGLQAGHCPARTNHQEAQNANRQRKAVMSNAFVGVFVRSSVDLVNERISGERLRNLVAVAPFSDNVTVVFQKDSFSEAFAEAEFERLARELSLHFSVSLLLHFNDQVGYRSAELYENGASHREFGPDDELWVQLAENGELEQDSPPLKLTELVEDEEYGTFKSAVDLGFEAFGDGSWPALVSFFPKCRHYL